ncbi:hypothetical protein CYMTET_40095 [Cymbomonas tetramitiformis]|uniref:Uncharacterized protein n=1 Tax=Cymbomonas tetramitiformis TaxID=36881 RepID=A0AAE0C8T0_9CHLO|nr:hypothetical protein CYMTET_40095 [Cymbomonas tetramitiformis]
MTSVAVHRGSGELGSLSHRRSQPLNSFAAAPVVDAESQVHKKSLATLSADLQNRTVASLRPVDFTVRDPLRHDGNRPQPSTRDRGQASPRHSNLLSQAETFRPGGAGVVPSLHLQSMGGKSMDPPYNAWKTPREEPAMLTGGTSPRRLPPVSLGGSGNGATPRMERKPATLLPTEGEEGELIEMWLNGMLDKLPTHLPRIGPAGSVASDPDPTQPARSSSAEGAAGRQLEAPDNAGSGAFPGLECAGLARPQLNVMGLGTESIDRLYRGLFIHAVSFQRFINQVALATCAPPACCSPTAERLSRACPRHLCTSSLLQPHRGETESGVPMGEMKARGWHGARGRAPPGPCTGPHIALHTPAAKSRSQAEADRPPVESSTGSSTARNRKHVPATAPPTTTTDTAEFKKDLTVIPAITEKFTEANISMNWDYNDVSSLKRAMGVVLNLPSGANAPLPILRSTNMLGMTMDRMGHALSLDLADLVEKVTPIDLNKDWLMHPLVEESTAELHAATGMHQVVHTLQSAHLCSALLSGLDLGIEVNDRQLPQLFIIVNEAANILQMEVPRVLILTTKTPEVHAMHIPGHRPCVVISGAAMDLLDPTELQAMVAAKMLLISRMEYRLACTAAMLLQFQPELIKSIEGVAAHWDTSVKPALDRWRRYIDLTGDRAALLVAQSISIVASAIMKICSGSPVLSGALNVDALMEAASNMTAMESTKLMSESDPNHLLAANNSLAVMRVREIQRFAESEHFGTLMNHSTPILHKFKRPSSPKSSYQGKRRCVSTTRPSLWSGLAAAKY